MELKTIDDLKSVIVKYTKEEKDLIKEEEQLLNELDYSSILSSKRKKIRNLAYEKRNEINQAKYIKERYFNMFSDLTTFDVNLLYPFLIKYLTKKENQEYSLIRGINEYLYPLSNITRFFDFNIFDNYYNIISTNDNIEKIKNLKSLYGDWDTEDIDEYLECLNDKKYICVESDDRHSLLNGPELSIEFKNFPYLKDVAYSLIEKKFEEPNISDSLRLESVLIKEKIKKK